MGRAPARRPIAHIHRHYHEAAMTREHPQAQQSSSHAADSVSEPDPSQYCVLEPSDADKARLARVRAERQPHGTHCSEAR
jgi:hypothetical protein